MAKSSGKNTDRIIAIVAGLAVALALGLAPAAAFAAGEALDTGTPMAEQATSGYCGHGVTWILDDEGKLTISKTEEGSGDMDNYSSSYSPWYDSAGKITAVVIKNGVASIGKYAFYNCTELVSVEIPSGVASIGEHAFGDCSSLEHIYYGGTLDQWASISGTNNVPSNAKIHYGNGKGTCGENLTWEVTGIGDDVILEISGMGVMSDYDNYDNKAPWRASFESSITKVVITGGVTSIGAAAFNRCLALEDIEIPDGVTSIGSYAFRGCTSLEGIEIPSSVTSVGQAAFFNCEALKDIEIPSGVTSIEQNAFYNCEALKGIEIPSSVTSIQGGAFSGCSGLAGIEIPSSVTSIGSNAFSGCLGLTGIEIPSSVTSIGSNAFQHCEALTSIEIPSSVTSIKDNTFGYCKALASVKIPDSVTSIGEGAFLGCIGLTGIEIPSSVTSIEQNAFYNCEALTGIEIPSSVTSIGDGAFSGCSGLTGIEIPSSVMSIGSYTFDYCTKLASVKIPDSVTSIGDYAFHYCKALTEVEIPASMASIGEGAFDSCDGLKDVYYNGTEDQWKGVEKGEEWAPSDPAIHFVYYVTVAVSPEDGGTVTGAGRLEYKDPAQLTAAPAAGYGFVSWTDDETGETVSADNPYAIPGDKKGNMGLTANFTIEARRSIGGAKVTLEKTSYIYDGKAKKPAVKSVVLGGATLKEGTDYTVSYKDNVKVGTATVTVTGKGNYKDSASATFTIKAAPASKTSIAKAKVTLSKKSYAYDGKTKKPKVKSVVLNGKKLKAGADYTVKYKNNKKLGTATVTITGKGAYIDSAKATFKIVLAKAKLKTEGHMSASLFTAYWDKVAGAKGYQLQYKQAGGKWKTLSTSGTTKDVGGLKAGKFYQYRVRAVAGKHKGAWSNVSKRYLHSVKGVKATVGKPGTVTATWQADPKANAGYVVVVRYEERGKVIAMKKVAAGKTSVTVKGLEKSKRLRVQVRPLRTSGGLTYAGVLRATWAKEKPAKV